jgi:hypothetical protein
VIKFEDFFTIVRDVHHFLKSEKFYQVHYNHLKLHSQVLLRLLKKNNNKYYL